MRVRIPSLGQVQPGVLVSHRYAPEMGIILRAEWNQVDVLLTSGAVVRWGMDGFRSIYEVIDETR